MNHLRARLAATLARIEAADEPLGRELRALRDLERTRAESESLAMKVFGNDAAAMALAQKSIVLKKGAPFCAS